MLMTLVDKKSVMWSPTMTLKFLVLLLSVLARVNGQWEYDDNDSTASLQEGERCRIKTGEQGICRRLSSCTVYYEDLKRKTIKYNFLVRCSFIDSEEVICCPLQKPTADQTTEQTRAGGGKTVVATLRPTTPKITTTTTIRPIVVGGKTITGNEPFLDLSKLLKVTTTKIARRQSRVDPQESPINNNNFHPNQQQNFNNGFQNPWIGNPNTNIQNQGRPFIQQNNVRFPTEPNIWKTHQAIQIDPDVEVFNTIDPSRNVASEKLAQFPFEIPLPTPQIFTKPPPPKTEAIVAQQNDIFEQFKFRPSSENSNVPENNDNNSWAWSNLNAQRREETTSRRAMIAKTTTTTTNAPILTNWMVDALNQATVSNQSTSRRPTISTVRPRLPPAPVTVIPFSTSPSATPSSTVENVTPRGNRAERPSQAACQTYNAINPAGLTFHILDGVPVAPGEFPHIGGLIFPQGGGSEVDNRCGSSLISERYVLTAAHCVNDPLSLPTVVRLGVVIWNIKDEDTPTLDAEIETITLHPEYRSHLRYHDIALIKLKNDVTFTPYIRPACLNSDLSDIDSSIPLVVIGWGVTNVQTRTRSEILLMTNVTTVALNDCNATHVAYGTSRAYRSGLNEGHYCAFDPELKKDACQSDSGGPLQLVRNKKSTIVGIVSFGLSCGSAVPSVYVRVAYYLDWIESIVWPS